MSRIRKILKVIVYNSPNFDGVILCDICFYLRGDRVVFSIFKTNLEENWMGCTKNLTKIENHNTTIWQIFTPGRKRKLISEKGLIYPQVGVDRELRAKEEKGNS